MHEFGLELCLLLWDGVANFDKCLDLFPLCIVHFTFVFIALLNFGAFSKMNLVN